MAGNGNAWPKTDSILLTKMATMGVDWSIIAKAIGKTVGQCKAKWERVKYYDAPQPEIIYTERRCLACGSSFQSEWIGNRVCKTCKTSW